MRSVPARSFYATSRETALEGILVTNRSLKECRLIGVVAALSHFTEQDGLPVCPLGFLMDILDRPRYSFATQSLEVHLQSDLVISVRSDWITPQLGIRRNRNGRAMSEYSE